MNFDYHHGPDDVNNRVINWDVDTSTDIIFKINDAAKKGPHLGLRDEILGTPCILRGAHPEDLTQLEMNPECVAPPKKV